MVDLGDIFDKVKMIVDLPNIFLSQITRHIIPKFDKFGVILKDIRNKLSNISPEGFAEGINFLKTISPLQDIVKIFETFKPWLDFEKFNSMVSETLKKFGSAPIPYLLRETDQFHSINQIYYKFDKQKNLHPWYPNIDYSPIRYNNDWLHAYQTIKVRIAMEKKFKPQGMGINYGKH